MSEEKTVHCVTCCQALPAGMEHPEFFSQNLLTPDPTSVYDVYQELDFLLSDIAALLNILCDREEAWQHETHRDTDVLGAYGLLQNLAAESRRRAIRLRNAGLYWQGVDRNDNSLFPDLPPPQRNQDCPHTVYDAIRGCHACGKQDPYGKEG